MGSFLNAADPPPHKNTYTKAHVHTRAHAHIEAMQTHTFARTPARTHTRTHTCTRTHTRAHTCTHTRTHAASERHSTQRPTPRTRRPPDQLVTRDNPTLLGCAAAPPTAGAWLVPAEVFSLPLRARAMSLATFANRGLAALLAATFLSLRDSLGDGGALLLFAAAAACRDGFPGALRARDQGPLAGGHAAPLRGIAPALRAGQRRGQRRAGRWRAAWPRRGVREGVRSSVQAGARLRAAGRQRRRRGRRQRLEWWQRLRRLVGRQRVPRPQRQRRDAVCA